MSKNKTTIEKIETLAKADRYGKVDGTYMNGETAKEIMTIFNHPKMSSHSKDMETMKAHELVGLTIRLYSFLKPVFGEVIK